MDRGRQGCMEMIWPAIRKPWEGSIGGSVPRKDPDLDALGVETPGKLSVAPQSPNFLLAFDVLIHSETRT